LALCKLVLVEVGSEATEREDEGMKVVAGWKGVWYDVLEIVLLIILLLSCCAQPDGEKEWIPWNRDRKHVASNNDLMAMIILGRCYFLQAAISITPLFNLFGLLWCHLLNVKGKDVSCKKCQGKKDRHDVGHSFWSRHHIDLGSYLYLVDWRNNVSFYYSVAR
jgi:hypothetical protein